MEFKLELIILASLLVVFATGSNGGAPSVDYWKSVLPNTPLPSNIRIANTLTNALMTTSPTDWVDQLGDRFVRPYFRAWQLNAAETGRPGPRTNDRAYFFLEKNLNLRAKMNFQFKKSTNLAKFLPRRIADSLPLSTNKLPELLKNFSVDPNSDAAGAIKHSIQDCEIAAMSGEVKLCATSLESMIDFSTSVLGQGVDAIWTEVGKADDKMKQYEIVGLERMPNRRGVVTCHKMSFPYGVFYCHKLSQTVAYKISMVAAHGPKIEAAATCHRDTSAWDPKFMAFKMLNVKPGGPAICHFLPEGHIVWVGKT